MKALILDNNSVLDPSEEQLLALLRDETKMPKYGCAECQAMHGQCWECTKRQKLHELYAEAGITQLYFDKTINSDWNLKQDVNSRDLSLNDLRRKKFVGALMLKYINALPALMAGKKFQIKNDNGIIKESFNSVLLVGGSNSGKTLLSAIAIQSAIAKGKNCKMFEWSEICSAFQSFDARQQIEEIAEEMKLMDLVVIDGVTNYNINTPFFLMNLDRVSRARLNSNNPTIITCDPDYVNIQAKQGWNTLLNSCKKLELPTPSLIS